MYFKNLLPIHYYYRLLRYRAEIPNLSLRTNHKPANACRLSIITYCFSRHRVSLPAALKKRFLFNFPAYWLTQSTGLVIQAMLLLTFVLRTNWKEQVENVIIWHKSWSDPRFYKQSVNTVFCVCLKAFQRVGTVEEMSSATISVFKIIDIVKYLHNTSCACFSNSSTWWRHFRWWTMFTSGSSDPSASCCCCRRHGDHPFRCNHCQNFRLEVPKKIHKGWQLSGATA